MVLGSAKDQGERVKKMNSSAEYLEELELYHYDLEKIATNGERVTLGDDERYTDSSGRFGYCAHFGGGWICYTCGLLCECGEGE